MLTILGTSYTVHVDCKGHTGAMMTFVKGAMTSFSWKQKINTKSSTEAELIGVDDADAMGIILYRGARYMVRKNELTRKPSAIKLEENSRASSSKCMIHIHIWYFFIKDKIDTGEICVKYCFAEKMLADGLSKP